MAYIPPTTGKGGGPRPTPTAPVAPTTPTASRRKIYRNGAGLYIDAETGQAIALTGRTGGQADMSQYEVVAGPVAATPVPVIPNIPEPELDPNSPEYAAGAIQRRRRAQNALRYGFMSTLRSLRNPTPTAGRVGTNPPGLGIFGSSLGSGKIRG